MTTTQTARDMIAACLANPADDTARLVLADAYAEAGDEPRGEFVRVQVELAKHSIYVDDYKNCRWCDGTGDVGDYHASRNCRHCNGSGKEDHVTFDRVTQLRIREAALIAANPQWRPVCPVCDGSAKRDDLYVCTFCQIPHEKWHGSGRVGTFARGLLHRVDVPSLDAVMVRRGRLPHNGGTATKPLQRPYIITPWASALLRDFPEVREMVPADQTPWHVRRSSESQWKGLDEWFTWINGGLQHNNDGSGRDRAELPEPLFRKVAKVAGEVFFNEYARFATSELAVSALGVAVRLTLEELP